MVSSSINAHYENKVNSAEETTDEHIKPSDNEIKVSEVNKEMEYTTENAKKVTNVQSKANGVGDIPCNQSVNQAEPRFWFVSLRRPGSFISISRKDYHQLKKGNTIHFVNSRLGSPMSIRLMNDVELPKKKSMSQDFCKIDPDIADEPKSINNNSSAQGKEDSAMDVTLAHMENEEEAKSKEVDNPHIDCFYFTSVPYTSLEQKAARKRLREPRCKARNACQEEARFNIYIYSPLFDCRNHLGMKRKPAHHLCDSDHRPRKQHVLESSYSIKSCFSVESNNILLRSCINFPCSNVSCMSMNCRVAEDLTQELVARVGKE